MFVGALENLLGEKLVRSFMLSIWDAGRINYMVIFVTHIDTHSLCTHNYPSTVYRIQKEVGQEIQQRKQPDEAKELVHLLERMTPVM